MTCQIGLLIVIIWVTAGQETAVHWVSRSVNNTRELGEHKAAASTAGAQPNPPVTGGLAYDFILLFS